jgi:exodeoxyribonuclease V beta subunit
MTAAPQELDVFAVPLGGVQLIEASAGTGKTWAICGLYMRLLLEQRHTVQQILVVTFTNAATAELRERVRKRLVETLAGLQAGHPATAADPFVPDLLASLRTRGADDADLQRRLAQALQDFDEAAIFTIHGFCQRALADTPFAAQMPMVQELLADDSAVLAEAVHDFWRQRVAAAGTDAALVAHLLAEGDSPERWMRLLRRQLARPLSRPLWPADIDAPGDPAALAAAVDAAFQAARSAWPGQRSAALAALHARLAHKQLHRTHYKPETIAEAAAAWDAWLAAASPGTAAPATTLALLGSTKLARWTTKGQTPPDQAFFGTAQALLDALAASDRALRLARMRLLRDLLREAAERQRLAKRAQRVVAFDDMLANLHQRLHAPGAAGLAAALRQRFPAALIDEFQDTDPLQWAVFQAIYGLPQAPGNGAAAPLFLVGDPKQAIYSFRHADLHTYLQARGQALHCHTLGRNQRAVRPLIDALNHLFGQHDNAFLQAGLHYHPVREGRKPKPLLVDASEPRAALQVWTLPRQRSGPLMKAEARQRAAATCAGEIARLLTQAQAGRITLGAAPLAAGQIAVLVRSHAQGSVMRQALAALGVGSVELSQASVFQSADAEELERVLAAMLQPGRDGLLKAALATRWHGLAAHQIDALAADEAGWLAQVQACAEHGALWRQRGIGVALQHWRQAEQVAGRLLRQPDGARRLTNLLHLGELLHQASAGQPSPEALLRWMQAQREDPRGDDATQLRLDSDQHLVQIVTIHKSKGLEYPVVFCPFLWDGRSAGSSDGLDGVPGRNGDGEAVVDFRRGLDPAFDEAGAKAQARLDDAAEGLRLVYVALTRAVQRCYLVAGSYCSQYGRHVGTTESARSLLNWLLLGSGLQAADWFNPRRKTATPAEIDAAWGRLALPGALAVAALPPAWLQPLPAADDGAAALQALVPPTALPRGWWIGSYSSLVQGADAAAAVAATLADSPLQPRAGADHDAAVDVVAEAVADGAADPGDGAAPALAADDLCRFPRGTLAGECVHAAFELADFSDPRSWPAAIDQALLRHGPLLPAASAAEASPLAAMLQRGLADVLATPLPVGTATPLRLDALGPLQRLNELEFHLHAPQLSASALVRCLADHGYAAPRLAFGQLQGYLKGFIDLVLQHEGRWFVVDWKSNHLGDAPGDYSTPRLEQAMTAHHYQLQSLVYSLALQRWLQLRLPGYQHGRHFGGALYLFVRGLRPGWRQADGSPTGAHLHRPSAAVLQQLSALLDGGTA